MFRPRDIFLSGIIPFRSREQALSISHPRRRVGRFHLTDAGTNGSVATDETLHSRLSFERQKLFKAQADWPGKIISYTSIQKLGPEIPFADICGPSNEKSQTGKDLIHFDVTMHLTISFFGIGFGTVIYTIQVPDNLNFDLLLRLVELCRKTDPFTTTASFANRQPSETTLYQIASDALVEFQGMAPEWFNKGDDSLDARVAFSYPVLYLGSLPGVNDAKEIRFDHGRSLTAMVNILRDHPDLLKDFDVNRVMATDVHPYRYGVMLITPGLTIEAHGDGTTPEAAHLTEMLQALLIAEFPVIQLFALRYYNEATSAALKSAPLHHSSTLFLLLTGASISAATGVAFWMLGTVSSIGFSPAIAVTAVTFLLAAAYFLFTLIVNLQRKRKFILSLNGLRSTHILHDTYLQRAIDQYRSIFPINILLVSLDQKLAALDGTMDASFRIATALLTVFLFPIIATQTWLSADFEALFKLMKKGFTSLLSLAHWWSPGP